MLLFVNGCVRKNSRTLELARAVLAHEAGELEELCLYPDGPEGLDAEGLELRDGLLKQGEYDHPLLRWAKQFAQADVIVIAAPYWDLLFPAKLRAYLEAVTAGGVTFRYNAQGVPEGLCCAKRMIYVTTAGGPIIQNFGYEYVEALAKTFYGIADVRLVKAEGLDIWGADPAAILEEAKRRIPEILC